MELFFSDLYSYFIKPLFELVNPLYIALVIGGSQVLFTHVPIKLFREHKRNTVLVLSILLAIPFAYSYYTGSSGFMSDVFLWKAGGLAFNYIIAVSFYHIIIKKIFDLLGYTEKGRKKKTDGGTPQ